MFESVSTGDERSSPAKPLKRRTGLTVPAGTEFHVDDDQILALLSRSDVSEEEQSEIVASLRLGSDLHEFTFFDVSLIQAATLNQWKESRADDRAHANLTLMLELYLQRYPFEDAEVAESAEG
jgi:hypothetical protein